ncbi:SLH domain protein [Geotalea daltonii FRC-32]|uniref:SLH domain protein n=1 Tax=Geotalea daltonii (strain DSM 22248 / JCM 15807 / FRC-32) TaxID=316067 RepID=B9M4B0_GEODF|nr:S-layer homology domain-containing protein [Geotalea daltonii]ACM21565.1 SLH domain protein [Geotalea daltonii FRC-32]
MKEKLLSMLLAGITAGVLSACSGPQVRCTTAEDNPEHHYLRGMEALEKSDITAAREKFDRALYCNEKYSPAYAGNSIVAAEKSRTQGDDAFRTVEVGRSRDFLDRADKYADTTEEQFDYYLAVMRDNTILKEKGWLKETEGAFGDAAALKLDEQKLVYYQGKEAADYFMGLAYLQALEFRKARDKFADVLNARREGKWHDKADRGWKKTDRTVRAMSGLTIGDVGKKIAVKDSVSRGDLAALLMDEMKMDKLMAGRLSAASQGKHLKAEFTPADIADHQFKDEILTLLKWKVRGLEPRFDETTKAYLFKPAEAVTRGEMAFILEDVLIKLTGDEKLATAYFGQEQSPFPDVRSTSPFFNAVMNMTTRAIMEGELSGEFRINEPVDGAEALLAVRVLKQKINIR